MKHIISSRELDRRCKGSVNGAQYEDWQWEITYWDDEKKQVISEFATERRWVL